MRIDYVKKEQALQLIKEGWRIVQEHSYNYNSKVTSTWPYYLVHDDFVTKHRIHHSTVSVIQKCGNSN